MLGPDLVLLSKTDSKLDCDGNDVELFEGKTVDIYMDDYDHEDYPDNLIATGTVELNNSKLFTVCKWNCRIDLNGIQHESEEIQKALSSDNEDLVKRKLLYITFHWDNWRWVQNHCINLLDNTNVNIRALAATCLGHLARIHKTIDKQKILEVFKNKQNDLEIKGQISDAIDDIKMFAK